MRRLFAAFLALLFAASVDARPCYKDWKCIFVGAASIGASLAMTHEAHDCRLKFDAAPCAGGYGEFKAREIARGVTAGGMFGISLWGRHQGFKEWALPALGFATYNGISAYRQTIVGCPAGESFIYGTKFSCSVNSWGYSETKTDFNSFALRH